MSVAWLTTNGTSTVVTYPSIVPNGTGSYYSTSTSANYYTYQGNITQSVNSVLSTFAIQQPSLDENSFKAIMQEMMAYYGVTDWKDIVNDIMDTYGVDIKTNQLNLKEGWKVVAKDGTVISLDDKGNVQVDDSNAKVVYKANTIRDFNKFLNASDLLEQFIRFTGTFGVRQSEVLNIPIETFINWLIIEAAKMDGEHPPDLPLIQKKEYKRCLCCGKFISNKMATISKFCSPKHFEKYMENNYGI
jgi:hypothetical protein